ncbi:MAG: winged helix-turn-helix transcriptional regulator [Sciscionella sp.]|nr:winged helix-turn-helix transcriptional regulator [Sciscionella sp.]
MPPPTKPPIGLQLSRISRAIAREFDAALAGVGSSMPIWLIMISLKMKKLANQQELANAVGIRGATLTHHLTAMEADGLITRHRDDANRRAQQVTLTEAGEHEFRRVRTTVTAFDRRLRRGLTATELDAFTDVLNRLHANAIDQ